MPSFTIKWWITTSHLSQINNTLLFTSKSERTYGRKGYLSIEKLEAIYDYVQKHMKWNGYEEMLPEGEFYQSTSRKERVLMLSLT